VALNSLYCSDVPLSNYSLTHSLAHSSHAKPSLEQLTCIDRMCVCVVQYYDSLSEALSVVDEEGVTNPVILVHTGVYRDESLFMDYSATVLGAGVCCRCCLLYCLCLRFHGNFPGGSGLSGVYWSNGWWKWLVQLEL